LCRRKPAGDFELATHHRGITGVDREVHIFEYYESIRLLHIIKKMHQGRPRAFGFNSSEYDLMIRRCFTRTNRGILDQDIMLAGHFL